MYPGQGRRRYQGRVVHTQVPQGSVTDRRGSPAGRCLAAYEPRLGSLGTSSSGPGSPGAGMVDRQLAARRRASPW